MSNLIVIRLHPSEAVDAATFTNYLNGLKIQAFALSFNDPSYMQGEAAIGEADYNPPNPGTLAGLLLDNPVAPIPNYSSPPPAAAYPHNTGVAQHFDSKFVGLLEVYYPIAIATAVIEVNAGAGTTFENLHLVVTRGSGTNTEYIPVDETNYYVVPLAPGPLPSPDQFQGLAATSLYLTLPPPPAANGISLNLPADGSPPPFDQLLTSVQNVLGVDPGGGALPDISQLTPAQCSNIAYEIVWSRQDPLPTPPEPIDQLYNDPPNTGAPTDQNEQDRKQFEGALQSFYSTRDATAQRLTKFVYALAAAIACEKNSLSQTQALLSFPANPNPNQRSVDTQIVLTGLGANPDPAHNSFGAPAAYFYVLGANLTTQITVAQRYKMVCGLSTDTVVAALVNAFNSGTISGAESFVTLPTAPPQPVVNPAQAAQRMAALAVSASSSVPQAPLAASLQPVITDWLAFPTSGPANAPTWPGYQSTDDDTTFWPNENNTQPAAFLALVLAVLTQGNAALANQIVSSFHLNKVGDLANVSAAQWKSFFQANPSLLPFFTLPGNTGIRIAAFINAVSRLFAVAPAATPTGYAAVLNAPPTLPLPSTDWIGQCLTAYAALPGGSAVTFGSGFDPNLMKKAGASVFPNDADAQAWLFDAITAIDALCKLSNAVIISAPQNNTPQLHFSIVEALYARGFTGPQDIQPLTQDDFQQALTGTIAYDYAGQLYSAAGATGTAGAGQGTFVPVNPDGRLTDCIPPYCGSPLGPVAYLAELLKLSEAATCENPEALPASGHTNLGDALKNRRGPLSNLAASCANLETPLPLIDIVNECLESITASSTSGGVAYDTAADTLGKYKLCEEPRCDEDGAETERACHNPATLLATTPQYSTPAAPVKSSAAYENLKAAFSKPSLPYSQPLDVSRTYLCHLGTTRAETMRVFRQWITEFVLDPSLATPPFQAHLWRYPLRLEIAAESLGLTPEEFSTLFANTSFPVWQLYGFATGEVGDQPWTSIVVAVSEFLSRTGLTYCEFLELWRSGLVPFRNTSAKDGAFPACEPCYADKLTISFSNADNIELPLRLLVQFIRLWRALRRGCCEQPGLSFAQLGDMWQVLQPITGGLNQEFIRQLAALLILHNEFRLPLADPHDPSPNKSGADRTHLLALWVGTNAVKWKWALEHLLEQVGESARRHHRCQRRQPKFVKLLSDNLDPLSRIAGFNPDLSTDTWHERPTHTLRFAEVLAKIYASDFGIGEILYLFTNQHLDGDDPFPLQEENEALDHPLALPQHSRGHELWELRKKLLRVEVDEEAVRHWTWPRIVASMRDEFGYMPGSQDSLRSLGEHFFPHEAHAGGPHNREYRTPLAGSSAQLWNFPPDGPFIYDTASNELVTQLPLRDAATIAKLAHMRQLNSQEAGAVQALYFLPRLDLAAFAFLFPDFAEAERHLIEEADETRRWAYFRRHFALAHTRCRVIAEHLAHQVAAVTGRSYPEGESAAWLVLRSLFADGNLPVSNQPWENDADSVPAVTWPAPSGGAFAALLGLLGTGLLGEFSVDGKKPVWREIRARTEAFNHIHNESNTPVPTMLPAIDLKLPPNGNQFVALQNGYALRDRDGLTLGGAEGFRIRWSGVLLVENEGEYSFLAGAPTPEGEPPDSERAEHTHWRVILARGQKTWVVLNHRWIDEQEDQISRLFLRPGAYRIAIEFSEPKPDFGHEIQIRHQHTGFQLKYSGPDTDGRVQVIPLSRLFRDSDGATLRQDIDLPEGSIAGKFLDALYVKNLRDIRLTHQRVFKALLFVHRFNLSAKPATEYGQSELGYMLAHPDRFEGISYWRSSSGFASHAAFFDFNFLPIRDDYLSLPAARDDRMQPSLKRVQALFDWWERAFDYVRLRETSRSRRTRPVWLLFEEAATQSPADPSELLRHIGVDLRHAGLVLHYFDATAANGVFTLTSSELRDDRWAVRVSHGELWTRRLLENFVPADITAAQPCLWVEDDPAVVLTGQSQSGNQNLVAFVDDGAFENGAPLRYAELKQINDGLRLRARDALVAYLTSMGRVPLPWNPSATATRPGDLSDLLLLDVEVGACEKASRIEEAISAVQSFIRRARLDLEKHSWTVGRHFARLWDRQFASFRLWQQCKRRILYKENWIDWEELERARRIEAFRFLESELQRSSLTVAVPGGLEWWPDEHPAAHPSLPVEQKIEPSVLRRLIPEREGFDLLGRQDRAARPSWLAPLAPSGGNNPPPPINKPALGGNPLPSARILPTILVPPDGAPVLPFWIESAVRQGTRFWRIAAAGEPPACSLFAPHHHGHEPGCCTDCEYEPKALVDEYYFWLVSAHSFTEPTQTGIQGLAGGSQTANTNGLQSGYQDAYYSQTDQQAELWQDPTIVPQLLVWDAQPAVRLAWCRVHDGEFQEPRYSDDSLAVTSIAAADLVFQGRWVDSLVFSLTNPGPVPEGYTDPTPPGFRYDIAADEAATLPQVVQAPAPVVNLPDGLPSYPYFAYQASGARLFPYMMFSPAIAIASALRAHCHFEPALRWYRLAFDLLNSDCTWVHCPKDQPVDNRGANNQPGAGRRIAAGAVEGDIVVPPRDEAGCCQTTGVKPAAARNRAILLHALDTMLDWADAQMRRNNPEHFEQARLLVDTADRVLGRRPHSVRLEEPPNPPTIANFSPAFAPLNPRLLDIYERVAHYRDLIHECLNARRLRNGRALCDMPYFGDERAREGWRTDFQICSEENEWCLLPSPYRFAFRIQKAQELAAKARELGAELLSAFEKGDAEYLAALRAGHERDLLELGLAVRQDQWRDADWQIQALQKTKAVNQTNLQYYQTLLNTGLIEDESQYETLTETAISTRAAGSDMQAEAEMMKLIPDLFVGFPCQETWIPEGTKLAGMFESIGRIIDIAADIASGNAGLDLTEAGWQRRQDEWTNQKNLLTIEVEQTEMQILGAQRRRDQAMRELNNNQRQIEQATEVLNFLRDKFTAQDLYLFLQKETSGLYFRMYELALHAARQAEHAYNFERGHTTRRFITDESWNRLQEGLMAGERLELALRRMEQSYLNENVREYELTKHFSLRLDFPIAYLQLRLTGRCEIDIPEWRFEAEKPGMFMRRIRNVSVTIPCVAGPYSGVNCTLTLLSSMTRTDPRLIPLPGQCCGEDDCGRNGYTAQANDPRVVRLYGAREAIATSSGQNDAGMFELNFRDERYLPFEYLGAVSRWRIELPPENNFFDTDTLTDFVLHLNYTAREGGAALRRAAQETADCHLPGNGWCLFDVRHDFPDAWEQLRSSRHNGRPDGYLRLRLGRDSFPFIPCSGELEVTGLVVLFDTEHHDIEHQEDLPASRVFEVALHEPDDEEDDWHWQELRCLTSGEWPCFYHGILPTRPMSVKQRDHRLCVTFRIPEWVRDLRRFFFVCRYQIPGRLCGCDPCATRRNTAEHYAPRQRAHLPN